MTISNVGMFRADLFIPIIHPGEAAIWESAPSPSGPPSLPVAGCPPHDAVDPVCSPPHRRRRTGLAVSRCRGRLSRRDWGLGIGDLSTDF